MIRAVLFDLDNTLIDTTPIEVHREARRWKICVSKAASTMAFEGVRELVLRLRKGKIQVGIVTSSVSYYAENLLRHHGIPYDALIAYHDAKPPKPSPAPTLAALARLKVDAGQTIGIGDNEEDALSMTRAGVRAYGAGWSPYLDRGCGWHAVLDQPSHVLREAQRGVGA